LTVLSDMVQKRTGSERTEILKQTLLRKPTEDNAEKTDRRAVRYSAERKKETLASGKLQRNRGRFLKPHVTKPKKRKGKVFGRKGPKIDTYISR